MKENQYSVDLQDLNRLFELTPKFNSEYVAGNKTPSKELKGINEGNYFKQNPVVTEYSNQEMLDLIYTHNEIVGIDEVDLPNEATEEAILNLIKNTEEAILNLIKNAVTSTIDDKSIDLIDDKYYTKIDHLLSENFDFDGKLGTALDMFVDKSLSLQNCVEETAQEYVEDLPRITLNQLESWLKYVKKHQGVDFRDMKISEFDSVPFRQDI